jgi:pimeloyl-ACP methyl ester carboxylesterase
MPEKLAVNRALHLQIICIVLGITGLVAYAVSKFSNGTIPVILTVAGLLGFLAGLILLARQRKRLWPILSAVAVSLLTMIAGAYLILFGLIFFFQDTIANQSSSFFQPKTISAEAAQALISSDVSVLDLTTPDGTRLHGWLVRNSTAARAPVVIYFEGSGSDASKMIPFAKKLSGWSVALVNYRGFGLSEGVPSQANAFADALFIYDSLVQRADLDPTRVVAMGYSLGTGVAVYLSAQRPVTATILVSPFDRMTLIGLKQSFLFDPLSGIMKFYFDSISRAPGIHNPLLCLVGSADTTVPPEYSRKLAGQWGGATKIIEYPGEDHSLLLHANRSWTDILDFLNGLKP